jgi:16S rRNA (adenine1518-N6/adenine1519-N6)-dimethyltransferase
VSIDEFTRITRAAFNQRRKTLRNSLTSGLGWSDDNLYAVLDQASVQSDARPEQVTVEEFYDIARAVKAREL